MRKNGGVHVRRQTWTPRSTSSHYYFIQLPKSLYTTNSDKIADHPTWSFDDAHDLRLLDAVLADTIVDDGVFIFNNQFQELHPEILIVLFRKIGLEDAFFDADSIEFADFGDLTQSGRFGYIIRDEMHHVSWLLV